MSTLTSILELIKHDMTDTLQKRNEDQNTNMDILDAAIGALQDEAIVDHNLDAGTTDFYIRWADGLQFCFGLVNMGTYDINTAFGDLFVSSAVTATFAAGFDTVLFPATAMNTNSSTGPLWAAHHSVTTAGLKVNVYSPIGLTNRTEEVSYGVWGTWSE